MARMSPLILLLTLGCARGVIDLSDDGAAGSDTGAVDGDGGSSSDGGAGDGGSSTSDGGASDGGASDGGSDPELDGSYSGDLVIIGAAIGYPEYSETCSGTVQLEVSTGDEPEIEGTAQCSFGGVLAWLGEQTVAISGQRGDGNAVDGSVAVEIEGAAFEEDWTGTLAGDSLNGSFAGSTTYDVSGYSFDVEFNGSFFSSRD